MDLRVKRDIHPVFPEAVPTEAVREKLLELLGMDEVPEEVDFEVGKTWEEDGIRLTNISFQNSLGETVPGILMRPLNVSDDLLPGVVCMPGTSGSAERVAHERYYRDDPDVGPLYGWGRELARRGYMTMAISLKLCFAREKDSEINIIEGKHLAPYGRTQMGILAEEALRAARVLMAQEGVDAKRIGLTGMSLGGNATWYAKAIAPWIRTGVPICGGVGRLADVIHKGDAYRHSPYYYIPHMLRYFDHPEIVAACMPPRPFLMISPTEDEDMPRSGVDALTSIVRPAYESMGHPEYFKVQQPQGNHVFRFEYFEWIVEWFDRFLRREN